MIIGARAHDFGKLEVNELATKIAQKEVSCIQLALTKAVADFTYQPGMLSPGMARYLSQAFNKKGLDIAVLGCYVNLTHPDEAVRAKLLNQFKEHIRYARDFKCSIVGTETGSVNHDYSFNPKNHSEEALQILISSVRELVDEAEKFGVIVGIEGVAKHVVHTPEKMKRVLDAIQSNNLQVIFDPVNFLSIENYQQQNEMMEKSFELFGDRIVIIHAKDFIVENNQLKTVEAGKGLLNYSLLLKLIKEHKPYVEILLENAKEATVHESIGFINDTYKQL